MGLTQQQKNIAQTEKSLFVSAGPGVGKSHTLAESVAFNVAKRVDPSKIKVFSFSRTATKEIREKIEKEVSRDAFKLIEISTIHSFAYKLLRSYGNLIGFKTIRLVDDSFFVKLLAEEYDLLLEDAEQDYQEIQTLKIFNDSDKLKTKGDFLFLEKYSLEHSVVNFVDLLFYGYKILNEYKSVAEHYAKNIEILYLDEAQDTNILQIDFIDKVVTDKTRVICFGDIKQTLYRFAYADPFYLLEWVEKRKMEIVSLNLTFRFGKKVSDHALLISNLMDIPPEHKAPTEVLESNHTDLNYIVSHLELDNVVRVCNSIEVLYKQDVPLHEIAVLFRTNRQSMAFQTELMKRKIPFFCQGANFLKKREIQCIVGIMQSLTSLNVFGFDTVLSQMKVGIDKKILQLLSKSYKEQFNRLAPNMVELFEFSKSAKIKGIGTAKKKSIEKLFDMLSRSKQEVSNNSKNAMMEVVNIFEFNNMPFMYEGNSLSRQDHYENRIEILREFSNIYDTSSFETFDEFLDYLKVEFSNSPETDNSAKNKVYLGTIHSSKGKTIPYVYLILERCLVSIEGMGASLDDYFVAFVGITRAKKELTLVATLETAQEDVVKILFKELDLTQVEETLEEVPLEQDKRLLANYRPRSRRIGTGFKKVAETEKAYRIDNGVKNGWVPKKALSAHNGDLYVAEWFSGAF